MCGIVSFPAGGFVGWWYSEVCPESYHMKCIGNVPVSSFIIVHIDLALLYHWLSP